MQPPRSKLVYLAPARDWVGLWSTRLCAVALKKEKSAKSLSFLVLLFDSLFCSILIKIFNYTFYVFLYFSLF